MTSISKKIKVENFYKLLDRVARFCGYPQYHEELTIYLRNATRRATVVVGSNHGIRLFYRDRQRKLITALDFRSDHLKGILRILTKEFGNIGTISISPVYEFRYSHENQNIKFIQNSLIGPIVTVSGGRSRSEVLKVLGSKNVTPIGKIANVGSRQTVIDYSIQADGVLHTKIISYLERNGIFMEKETGQTYREILRNKSNDYSSYEPVFLAATHHELLSRVPLSLKDKTSLHDIKVSVIIPCHNSIDSLHRTLQALAAQRTDLPMRNLEVIIVDDGSHFSVEPNITKNRYPYSLSVIRIAQASGASTARNIGSTYAKGDIFIFLDSDILIARNYLQEHIVRNMIIPNAIFVSFKENISATNPIINDRQINNGLEVPNVSHDLRIYKKVKAWAIGSYTVDTDQEVEILETTNFFKSFHGSRIFGVYDLSCMVISHNFSARKEAIRSAIPFSNSFVGWGMEDVYLGLKLISGGNFIIPVVSTGVYHINHPPRSGNSHRKRIEYRRNTAILDQYMDTIANEQHILDRVI